MNLDRARIRQTSNLYAALLAHGSGKIDRSWFEAEAESASEAAAMFGKYSALSRESKQHG